MTSTALIDLGAATGAIAQLTGHAALTGERASGDSAGFRKNLQQILNALKTASPVTGDPVECSLPSTGLSVRIQQVTAHRNRSHAGLQHIRTALRPDATKSAEALSTGALTEPRKANSEKRASTADSAALSISITTLETTSSAPLSFLPQIPAATPVSDAQASALLSPATNPISQITTTTAVELKEEVPPDAEDATGDTPSHLSSLPTNTSGLPGGSESLHEIAVPTQSGEPTSATMNVADAHIASADLHPETDQPLTDHSTSVTGHTSMPHPSPHLEADRTAQHSLGAAPSLSSKSALTQDASSASKREQRNSTTPTPQQHEPRSQRPSAAGAADAGFARPKPTEIAPTKVAAGTHSAATPTNASYTTHLQDQSIAPGPLTVDATMRSEHASVLSPRAVPQSSASTARDPFAALDRRTAAPAPTWSQAGTHHAEAGYLDPSLGWIGVRAEGSGFALHATIVPGSGEAAQALGGHVASLNSFVAEHHGRSSTVAIASPDQGQQQSALNNSSGGSPQQQPHQQSQRGGASLFASSAAAIAATPTSSRTTSEAPLYSRQGAHISVIA
ncbi:hypothetical protein [Occallatibacter riparius]|uniref:Uncharacterized protein n=1 Tax=Occallatibacter riparius TaxID=1002689 RepID=A0A9J7BJY3_9BACT|nr:hypothetical protein [Occallatibacter riparius]UWZ83136.1 hypothetical protein MOP44_21515 [Occallatibacter riparius]